MPRYEIPALILVDADSETDAHTMALGLGPYLDETQDTVTVAVTDWPRQPEDRNEPLSTHAESLQSAAGMQ